MLERSKSVVTLALAACLAWAMLAWALDSAGQNMLLPGLVWHKVWSVALAAALGIYLFFAVGYERTH